MAEVPVDFEVEIVGDQNGDDKGRINAEESENREGISGISQKDPSSVLQQTNYGLEKVFGLEHIYDASSGENKELQRTGKIKELSVLRLKRLNGSVNRNPPLPKIVCTEKTAEDNPGPNVNPATRIMRNETIHSTRMLARKFLDEKIPLKKVHHGGESCVVPFFGDQPFWGERVHARGVGPAPISVEDFCLDKLVAAIKFMLNPEVKERAVELAKAMENEDGVTGAVQAFYRHFPLKSLQKEPEKPQRTSRFSSLKSCFGCSGS